MSDKLFYTNSSKSPLSAKFSEISRP